MGVQGVFKRYEVKYLLTTSQYLDLKAYMSRYMAQDEYGRHTIHNLYFDTPDYLLIRRSLEKPTYKEKLRVRGYGQVGAKDNVFVEMKKKYHGVVYKRRLHIPQDQALDFLTQNKPLETQSQIGRELAYFLKHYGNLKPALGIHYDREAFYGVEDGNFRMTFDHEIAMEEQPTSLVEPKGAKKILPPGFVLLEVKTELGLPQWLVSFFSAQQIYKTSFSKYGTAYQKFLLPKETGGTHNVA